MAEISNIAWTDSTVNFWSGCTKVSTGCAECYAEARDNRHLVENVSHWGKGAPRLKHVGAVKQARAMNRKPWIHGACGGAFSDTGPHECNGGTFIAVPRSAPVAAQTKGWHRRRIFSLSLGDIGDLEVPLEWFNEAMVTIDKCRDVTWILCTKRPADFLARWLKVCEHWGRTDTRLPANVIMLTSVENQKAADKRIPELLKIPAVCRGLSLEPLLGPVDLERITDANQFPGAASFDVLNGLMIHHDDDDNSTLAGKVDWLIIGGESGPKARGCNVEWIRALVVQGKESGVPTFVKQLGADPRHDYDGLISGGPLAENKVRIQNGPLFLKDKKGGEMGEWPVELRVREFPKLGEVEGSRIQGSGFNGLAGKERPPHPGPLLQGEGERE